MISKSHLNMRCKRLTGSYYIHVNGDKLYRVDVFKFGKKKSSIEIFKDNCFVKDQGTLNEHIITYQNVKKIFIPDDFKDGKIVPENRGNSILVNLYGNRYLEIGETIYEFSTPEPINHYSSITGYNNISYPVAYGEKYVYFMLSIVTPDKIKINGERVPRKYFEPTFNSVDMYIDYSNAFMWMEFDYRIQRGFIPLENFKMIHNLVI